MTDKKICIAKVPTGLYTQPLRQCRTPAKYGNYCALHNPEFVNRKKKEREERFDSERQARAREFCARAIGEMVLQSLEHGLLLPGGKWEATQAAPSFCLQRYTRHLEEKLCRTR